MFGGTSIRAPLAASFPRKRRTLRSRIKESASLARKGGIVSILLALPLLLIAGMLMAGESFAPGETKTRPGTYTRITALPGGEPGIAGVVMAIVRSSWGPLGAVSVLEAESQIQEVYGSGGASGTLGVLREAFRGRADQVKVIRLGTGGVKASVVLSAGATPKATLTALYEGLRANGFTVTKRVSLTDATRNEILVIENGAILESFDYAPGADDSTALVAAVNATSQYFAAEVEAVGAVDAVNQSAVAGGTEPTINGAALTAALGITEIEEYDVLVTDLEDASSHVVIAAHVDRVRSQGQRIMAVVGEPTSVAEATRRTNASALNHEAVVYVGNGFETTDGDQEGRLAAARVAGMISAAQLTDSLTNRAVEGATDLVGALTGSGYEAAINAGMLTFSFNARRQPAIEYGITTLVDPPPDLDNGWTKIRRVRTRDALMSEIVVDTEELRGKVNNDKPGRDLLQGRAQGTANRFVASGALLAAEISLDPGNAPGGDFAYFVAAVDDLDSLEKVYWTFGFRFTQPLAA